MSATVILPVVSILISVAAIAISAVTVHYSRELSREQRALSRARSERSARETAATWTCIGCGHSMPWHGLASAPAAAEHVRGCRQ